MQRLTRGVETLWFPGPVHSALVTLVGLVALYLVAFPYRTDYAAHAAAGFALVVLIMGVLRLAGVGGTWQPLGSVLAVWGLVLVTELTITGPGFDPVDVSNSMLGAVLAGAALLERPARRSELPALAVLAMAGVLLALGLRYGSPAIG